MIVEVELSDLFTDNYIELQKISKAITRQLKDEILVTPEVTVGKERFPAAERRKSRQGKRLTGQQINLKKLFSKQTICSPDTDGLSCINTSSIFPDTSSVSASRIIVSQSPTSA